MITSLVGLCIQVWNILFIIGVIYVVSMDILTLTLAWIFYQVIKALGEDRVRIS